MSSMCTTSKRPPKLRAACNECHAAKVRCSGEKTGCQRCANLGLVCIFSISRIGKVPGKRSKANRAAAAAAATAAAASTSSLSSTATNSTTSLISPLASPNEMPSSMGGFPHQSPKDERGIKYSGLAPHPTPGLPLDSLASMPVQDYSNHMTPFYQADGGISGPIHFSEPPCSLPGGPIGLGVSDVGNFCWSADLEQPIGPCATTSAALLEPPMTKGALPPLEFDRRVSHEWDIDGDAASTGCDPGGTSRSSCTTSIRQPATPPEFFPNDPSMGTTATTTPSLNPPLYPAHTSEGNTNTLSTESSSTTYLRLLNEIEQTFTTDPQNSNNKMLHTIDGVLAANQRYLTTLLHQTEHPSFDRIYDDGHLLFTVALSKVITLFNFGYADFTMRMETPNSLGCGDRLIRFGVFEIDFLEQKAICRSIFLRELKRARLCLSRLLVALGREGVSSVENSGLIECLCEEMRRRVDHLVSVLEGSEV